MARFRPFRGIRYSPDAVGGKSALNGVVAPPYDVIDSAGRDRLLESSPYNVTRLILNPDGHDAAGDQYRAWLADGVLTRDGEPAFYLYSQEFEHRGAHRRTGIIGALHLEPFTTGVVRRHETTFSHHKKDRLDLTTRTKANLSPIFGLYSNAEFSPEPPGGWDSEADIDVVHEGVRNRVWTIRDPEAIAAVTAAVDDRTIFIADGHHRYETALNYFGELNPGQTPPTGADAPDDSASPSAHVMAFLASFEDPGMIILPTHRIVTGLGGADRAAFERELGSRFEITRIAADGDGGARLMAALEATSSDVNAFACAFEGSSEYLLLSRPAPTIEQTGSPMATLDVTALHSVILGEALSAAGGSDPQIEYSPDETLVLERVASGSAQAAFLMKPMRADEMSDVCMADELLPQKSTYFFPKLLTGLVFHTLQTD